MSCGLSSKLCGCMFRPLYAVSIYIPRFLTSQVVGVAGLSDNFHSETFIFVVPPFSRLCCVFPPSGMCGLCHVQHLTWTVCFLRSKGISLFTETTRVFKWHLNHFMMSPWRLNKQKTVVEKECTNCKQFFLKTWRFSTYNILNLFF